MYYLVKWCSLPYEDSTWELRDDVDQSKIEEFEQLQAAKPDSCRVVSCAHLHSSHIIRFPSSSASLTLYIFCFAAGIEFRIAGRSAVPVQNMSVQKACSILAHSFLEKRSFKQLNSQR